jgi:hypothetical protein
MNHIGEGRSIFYDRFEGVAEPMRVLYLVIFSAERRFVVAKRQLLQTFRMVESALVLNSINLC